MPCFEHENTMAFIVERLDIYPRSSDKGHVCAWILNDNNARISSYAGSNCFSTAQKCIVTDA